MLAEMPLTASGKVNRLALPEAWRGAAAEDFIAPRTATEDVLANIWAAELNLNAVGVNDDFFALGGHSLLLARIATRIRKAFEIELPLRVLFEAATVAALADRIESIRRSGEAPNELPLVRGSRAGDLPLSFAQERLWFFDQVEPGSAAYNIPRALRLTGPLDRNALQQSLAAIHARHEVLRSIFQNVNGKPVLSFSEAETPGIPMLDLTELAAAEREAAVNIFVKEETARPFDLTRGPLLRLALAKLDEEVHVLVLTMHHIVSDGWSIGIALGELVAGYNAVVGEDSPPLHDLPVQYADFAAWQRQYLSGPVLEKQLEFWRAELRDSPVLINLPTDRPRPPLRSFHGARQAVSISTEPGNALKEIARSERATLFMTLLTAFQLLLACLSGDDDIVVGSPTAGRNRPETENLIGYFVNTVVLRTKVAGDPSFREVLRHVRDTALKAFAHQDMPFEKLVDEFGSQRSLEYNPLFQVWFVLQNVPGARQQWHGLKVEHLDIETSITRHDLQLTLWETAAGLEGAVTFSTVLFHAETIARVAEQFRALLAAVVAQPEISLSDLRAQLNEVGLAFQQQRAEHLMESSRERLRSAKRRAVSADFADYTDIRK